MPGWRAKTTERPRDRVEGDVVATVGQIDRLQYLAGFREDGRAVSAVAALVGGGKTASAGKRVGEGGRRERGKEGDARRFREIAAVG